MTAAALIAIEPATSAQSESRQVKATIKEAAHLMLLDTPVMRQAELVCALEAHMTPRERGLHFFEVREAIKELIDAHELRVFEVVTRTGATVRLVALSGSKLLRIA